MTSFSSSLPSTTVSSVADATVMNISFRDYMDSPFCLQKEVSVLNRLISFGIADVRTLLETDMYEISRLHGMGKGKMDVVRQFKDNIAGKIVEINRWRQGIILPSHEVAGMSLARRIVSLLETLRGHYLLAGKTDVAAICELGLIHNLTPTEIVASRMLQHSYTSERVRQILENITLSIWRNGFSADRLFINTSFIDELSSAKMATVGRKIDILRSVLGFDAPSHAFTNLFLLKVVEMRRYERLGLGFDYVLDSNESIREFANRVGAVIDAMQSTVRPMTLSEIISTARTQNGCSLSREFVSGILAEHPWIEQPDQYSFQIRYANLTYDYAKAARIVWSFGPLKKPEVDEINSMLTGNDDHISVSLLVAQNRLGWCRPQGRTGVWECSFDGDRRNGLLNDVREYVASHDLFDGEDAYNYFESLGYRYPKATVRTYLFRYCRVSCHDVNLFCSMEKAGNHPEIVWRSKRVANMNDWVAEHSLDYIRVHGATKKSALVSALQILDIENLFSKQSLLRRLDSIVAKRQVLDVNEQGLVCLAA